MTLPIRGSLFDQRDDSARWRARPLKRRAARGRAGSEIALSDGAPADGLDQAAPVKKDDHVDPALIRSRHLFEALQDAETVREARAGFCFAPMAAERSCEEMGQVHVLVVAQLLEASLARNPDVPVGQRRIRRACRRALNSN